VDPIDPIASGILASQLLDTSTQLELPGESEIDRFSFTGGDLDFLA
jgi:hypothetical protein